MVTMYLIGGPSEKQPPLPDGTLAGAIIAGLSASICSIGFKRYYRIQRI